VTAPTKKKSGKAGTVVVSAPGNGENMPKSDAVSDDVTEAPAEAGR
jgi:hypothetical protein